MGPVRLSVVLSFIFLFISQPAYARRHSVEDKKSRPQDSKPAAIFFYVGKKSFPKAVDYISRELETCGGKGRRGFDLKTIDLASVMDLDLMLKQMSLPKDTPILFSAFHGGVPDGSQPDYPETYKDFLFEPNGAKLKPGPVFAAVNRFFSTAPKFLDTCYGGICRGKAEGLATASDGPSTVIKPALTTVIEDEVVDLYCDSINECERFKSADKNKDGYVDGEEFEQSLIPKFGHTTSGDEYFSSVKTKAEVKEKKAECTKKKKKFESKFKKFACLRIKGRVGKRLYSNSVNLEGVLGNTLSRAWQDLEKTAKPGDEMLLSLLKTHKATGSRRKILHDLFETEGMKAIEAKTDLSDLGTWKPLKASVKLDTCQHYSLSCYEKRHLYISHKEGGGQKPRFPKSFKVKCQRFSR